MVVVVVFPCVPAIQILKELSVIICNTSLRLHHFITILLIKNQFFVIFWYCGCINYQVRIFRNTFNIIFVMNIYALRFQFLSQRSFRFIIPAYLGSL